MDKKILAIVAVVIIVVAGCAVILLKGGDKDDGYKSDNTDNRLKILGNADKNDYLDNDDVKAIQKMIDDKEPYDIMADANGDEKITDADVTYLQNILDAKKYNEGKADADKKTAEVKYISVDGDTLTATYPVKKMIVINSQRQLSLAVAIGVGDRIVAINDYIKTYWDSNLYKDYESLPSVGDRKNPTLALVATTDADTIVSGGKSQYAINITSETDIPGKQILRLTSWENAGLPTGALMLGFFTDADDAAEKYVKWMDDLSSEINDKLAKVENPKATKFYLGTPTYIYAQTDGVSTALTLTGATNVGNIVQTDKTKAGISASSESVRTSVALEGVDVFIYGAYIYTHQTTQEIQETLKDKIDGNGGKNFSTYYPTTNGVKNNNYYIINYDLPFVLGTLMGAYVMFGDVFTTEYVEETIKDYLDTFCNVHDYQFNLGNFVQKYSAA